MQKRHLDRYDIEVDIVEPLIEANVSRNLEFGAALVSTANDWQIATFTSLEKRLKASILIPGDDPAASVAEIEKRASDPQIERLALGRTDRAQEVLAHLRGRSSGQ